MALCIRGSVLGLSREKMVLMKSLRMGVGGGQEDYDDLEGIDWLELFNAAQWHQVPGLVYEALRSRGREKGMPVEVRLQFLYACHLNSTMHERIRYRLAEILREAAREDTELMLLKGVILAYSAYKRCEHRRMCDVDLLVREQDFYKLRTILKNLGYHTSIPRLNSRDLPLFAHCHQQVRFRCREGPPVETHFRLLNLGMPSAFESAWDDASPHEFEGILTWCPSPERFLLHLCLHAQQHSYSSLRYFVDIAVWSRSREIDAERFVALAQQNHLGIAAFYALTYTADLLGLPDGEPIRARLQPRTWKRRIFEILWQDQRVRSQQVKPVAENAELPRAFLLGEAPIREKVVFLWNVLMPPKKWITSADGYGTTRREHCGRILVEARRTLAGILRAFINVKTLWK